MTADEYTKGQLASLMWRAASKISFPAMMAVGLCVRNQVKDGNWLAVINRIDEQNVAIIDINCTDARNPRFLEVLVAVDGIFDGTRTDRWTNDGKFWMEVGGIWPWETPYAEHERTATVAGLEIFK